MARSMRAFFRLPGSTAFVAVLATFAGLVVASVLVLDLWYSSPEDPNGLSTLEALYAVFGMVFFEHVFDLPRDLFSR
ncbi:MAG: hypothetical protein ACRD0U_00200, partial [Acidimicrobiales bacterium]